MSQSNRVASEFPTRPIRTYAETAHIMRLRGEDVTAYTAQQIERQALAKLREAFPALIEEINVRRTS